MTTAEDPLALIARQRGFLPPGDNWPGPGPERTALSRAVAQEFGLAWIELGVRVIPPDILATLPRDYAVAHGVIPLAREERALQVALSDPRALALVDNLAFVAGVSIRPVLADAADIRQALDRAYGWELAEPESGHPGGEIPAGAATPDDTRDAPIIRLVEEILAHAIRHRASDVHLEPLENRFRVRHRIDGVLHETEAPAQRLQLPLISRLKIMANLSIAEKRVPQDGRIQVRVDGRPFDLRVSSLPTVHGESMVLRVLDHARLEPGLSGLGFLADARVVFERLITSPDGIMLVTGPTGSGKTSTLYASLQHLNRADRKIITVEDPVEYQLAGINQVPVNAAIGLNYSAALRAMLRQAPNVIMVGEIRDRETAEIALNASLTGHMVLSTLHTNDAPSALPRLIDMGARPFLVAASLRAVVAQRLVRRVCPACSRPHLPSPRELHLLGPDRSRLAGTVLARGAGCDFCAGTGYHGRLGIFEIFLVHDGIRAMIHANITANRLRHQARADGMRTMREDGLRKVLAGLTTIEEVVSVTVGDLN